MAAKVKPLVTQFDRLRKRFEDIRPDVTAEDRKCVIDSLGIASSTLSMYLNGDIRDLDTGVKILKILREKIEARNQIIN